MAFLLLTLILGSILANALYNVFSHPLRRFPGPLLARATRLFYSYYRSIGKLEIKTQELHKKYGNVVRIAPDELSFVSGASWADIYGSKSSGGKQLAKEPFFYLGAMAPNGEKNLGASSDNDHARIRGVLSHAFSEKALHSQERVLNDHVTHMTHRIQQLGGAQTDAVRWLQHCTYDIITDLSLGSSAGALDCDTWNPSAHLVFESVKEGIAAIEVLRFLPFRSLLVRLLMKVFGASRRQVFDTAVEKARVRMATGNYERADFMSYILRANKTSKELTAAEMTANVALLLDVGSETTASLLSGCLFYVTRDSTILNRLTREIRDVFETSEQITLKRLATLPYLHAVLQEALRLYPPVAGATPRMTPPSGASIDGHFVPGNMTVAINQYAAYRVDTNFADPLEFNPGRWLGESDFSCDKREVVQPFSLGPRNCLGRNLAWAEMRLIIGNLIWAFDLELTVTSENWSDQRTWFIWDKPALLIRFQPRGFVDQTTMEALPRPNVLL
ncbi:hypothetical protein N0V93_007812 [Gnomoniopsis smithogilvyi]|uniref:Cytochrome P450 n=1 Tax=Gnomoniopsis smithogilvyi TaxID=1191159 RepID=A0A9W8YLT6_9PEZI|nr:hypothetical protein N0V93_007812 [Gnomoniopsis smithogilvyi]